MLATAWWAVGGLATDTWSGTAISSTNGKDPCAALGAGWRLLTSAEWEQIVMPGYFFEDATYETTTRITPRAEGYACRCVKN